MNSQNAADFLARTAYNQPMPSALLLPPDIAGLLGRGGTIVTGNQRAARSLRLTFDRQCRAKGLASWQPPAIFAWDTWTASLYRKLLLNGQATRMLLNRTQELQIWRSAVEADGEWTSLQTVQSLATMAADAWHLLCAYRGQQRLRNLGVSGDTRNFQRWAQSFTRRCKADESLSAAELEETLIAVSALEATSAEMLFLGFDSRTPAQQALVQNIRKSGVVVEDRAPGPTAPELYLAAAESPDHELAQTAAWIRNYLGSHPGDTVAVIVPGLAAERREIDRVFRRTLAPELGDITVLDGQGPYEFSLGQTLASTPLVSVALGLLRLATTALSITNISRLLLSPYFATGQNELSARAEFDALGLRSTKILLPEITLARLIAFTSTWKYSNRIPGLLSQLRSLERTAAKLFAVDTPRQRPSTEWSEHIRKLLQAADWPGLKPLDSIEFQTRQKFDAALDELASLDFDGTRLSFAEALAHLESILGRTLFAPESRSAPIQIMAPLEAAGSHFDALCFLRASDLEWPARPAIHPLLGWRLQRELGMPGSDAELDTAHARRITTRIAASADTVVFSYAQQTVDSHQRPSPLLAGLALELLAPWHLPIAQAPIELENIEDNMFIPLSDFTVTGGANILKVQAACGFLAFAEQRLKSTPVDVPLSGMDARERGNIVHNALEHLWSQLHTQAALRALTPDQRTAQIANSIEYSLRRATASVASDSDASLWPAAYLDVQRQRLDSLLTAWLNLELDRPAFEVEKREESEVATIGPLSLKIRIDRVDRLLDEAGGRILLDYKTGDAKPVAWKGDRPDEPQLPLYAVLHAKDKLAAIAFANIRAGKDLALQGYSAREDVLAKSAPLPFGSFEEQLEDWWRVLTALADDFAMGDARVRPKSYPETCKYCTQRLLCRLDPSSFVIDEEAEYEKAFHA